jgi:coenzyme F420 hydrogenase subunit beta
VKDFTYIDLDLCLFCGTCIGICPVNALAPDGIKPKLVGKCIKCGSCYQNCPGIEVSFDKLNRAVFRSDTIDSEIGHFKKILIGHSCNEFVRKRASSGGIVTEVLLYMIRKGLVDGVITVGMDENEPWKAKVNIAKGEEEIINSAQSKYCLIPVNSIIRKISNDDLTYAMVGLPCHFHGIRNLQMNNLLDKDKIKFCLGIFCGFNMKPEATDYLIKKMNVEKKKIKSLEFRGGEWPGGFLIKDSEGKVKFIPKHYYNYLNLMFVQKRCLLCPDLTNEMADISVGDFWDTHLDHKGWSSIIVRTENGGEILKKAFQDKNIFIKDCSLDELKKSHDHLIDYKKKGIVTRLKKSSLKPKLHMKFQSLSLSQKIGSSIFFWIIVIFQSGFGRFLIGIFPISFLGNLTQKMRALIISLKSKKV